MENMTLKQKILQALDHDSQVDASQIGVIVDSGIVTLTGRVKSMAVSSHAIGVARNVGGVKAIAQEIAITDDADHEPTDEEISKEITEYFRRDTMIPEDQVQITVREGCVTVTGHVEWLYQKNAIDQVLRGVHGVNDYTDQVRVEVPISDSKMATKIAAELDKAVTLNTNDMEIVFHDGLATLSGLVGSRRERDAIVQQVKSMQGIDRVIDHLTFVEF